MYTYTIASLKQNHSNKLLRFIMACCTLIEQEMLGLLYYVNVMPIKYTLPFMI